MNKVKILKVSPNYGSIRKVFISAGTVADTLILHTFPRSRHIPTLSPFCLKLETYLRMVNLSYTPSFNILKLSSKGKKPWIEHNGNKIADSNFCIKYINKTFDMNLDSFLSEKEKGISQAVIRMMEENLLFTLAFNRWVDDLDLMQR